MSNALKATARSVRVWENVTRDSFETEIRPLGEPAVLRGLVADWRVVAEGRNGADALCQYLNTFSLEKPVEALIGPPEIRGRFFYDEAGTGFNFERRQVTLSAVLATLMAPENDAGGPCLYAGAVNIAEHVPGFGEAHALPLLAGKTDLLSSIWIGNRTRAAAHWDLPDNIACVAAGRREFTLFSMDQLPNLYIGPIDRTIAGQACSMVDFHAPDLVKYPRFADAMDAALIATLEPGDAIYVPSLWVHHVEALDPVGVLVNYWWRDAPAHMMSPRITLLHALLSLRDLPAAEKARWRDVFEHYIFSADSDRSVDHLPEAARGILGEMTPDTVKTLRAFLARAMRG